MLQGTRITFLLPTGYESLGASPLWQQPTVRSITALPATLDDDTLFASLRARQEQLDTARRALGQRWRTGDSEVDVGFALEVQT